MLNKTKSEFEILIPYRRYQNLRAIYRKERELNEIEAIILSSIFIFSNDSYQKSQQFYKEFFKTFNLNENKWFHFFNNIIYEMIGIEIVEPKVIDKYTLCGEIKLEPSIKLNIENKKFVGLKKDDIKKELQINFSIFKNIARDIANKNLNHIIESIFLNSIEILKNISHDRYKEDEDIINSEADLKKNYNESYIDKENYTEENIEIVFNKIKKELVLNSNNDSVEINSDDKNVRDIFDKYIENKLNDLIKFSIDNYFNDFNFDQYDEINNINYQIIDINNYQIINKKCDEFKNKYLIINDNRKLLIDDNQLLIINKKTFKLNYLNHNLGNITLLIESKLDLSLANFIKQELQKDNYKAFSLINNIKNNNEINKVDSLIISNIINWLKNNEIKQYIINKLISKLDDEIFINFINNNLITIDDWKSILKNDKQFKIKDVILKNKNKERIIEDNTTLNKLLDAIEYYDLEISDKNYFNLDLFKKIDVQVNLYKNIDKINDIYEVYELKKNIQLELDKLLKNRNQLQNKILDKYNTRIKVHIDVLENKNLDKLRALKDEFVNLLETIKNDNKVDNNEDLVSIINKINDKKLKNELHKMRKLRNELTHECEKKFPKKNQIKEIKNLSIEIKQHIEFLNKNREKINEEIKNN